MSLPAPTTPTNPPAASEYVGVNPFEGGGGGSGSGNYTLPIATSSVLGGVKAKARTTESVEVAVDSSGNLFVPFGEADFMTELEAAEAVKTKVTAISAKANEVNGEIILNVAEPATLDTSGVDEIAEEDMVVSALASADALANSILGETI